MVISFSEWCEANEPNPPKGCRSIYTVVTSDRRSVVYWFQNRKTYVMKSITVALPEPVIAMPVPDWVDGYDATGDLEFPDIARGRVAEWEEQALADIDAKVAEANHDRQ